MNKRQINIRQVCSINVESLRNEDDYSMIRYLDTGNITRNIINHLQILDRKNSNIPSRAQRKVRHKTIIYSTVRPEQEHYGFIENPPSNLIVSTGFATLDVKDNDIDPKFLFYALTRKEITQYLQTIAVNNVSSYPSINPDDLANIVLEIPERKESQQKIASVLTALDSKIALNTRINTELEALAKTIYDYWFVQFDFPDVNGRQYKASGGKMVWRKELKREVPEGWEVVPLSKIANITMGQSPPGESYNNKGDGSVFFQGCTDFGDRFPTIRQFTTQPSRFARKGDILLSVRAPVGSINVVNFDCCIGRGLAALTSKTQSDTFLFEVIKNFKQIFDRRNFDGTTFGAITKDDLFSLKVVLPPEKLITKFEKLIRPTFEMQNTNEDQNYQLFSLRDWLLPMLMNGQVKVEE